MSSPVVVILADTVAAHLKQRRHRAGETVIGTAHQRACRRGIRHAVEPIIIGCLHDVLGELFDYIVVDAAVCFEPRLADPQVDGAHARSGKIVGLVFMQVKQHMGHKQIVSADEDCTFLGLQRHLVAVDV